MKAFGKWLLIYLLANIICIIFTLGIALLYGGLSNLSMPWSW